jgi:hypothetical protein
MTRFADTRRLLALLGAVFALSLLTACSPKRPENTVSGYLKAVAEGRLNDATAYFSEGDAKGDEVLVLKDQLWDEINELSEVMRSNNGLKTILLKFVDKNDDIARADIEVIFNNDKTIKTRQTLVKEKKKWLIRYIPAEPDPLLEEGER